MTSDNIAYLNIRTNKDIPNDTTAAAIAEGRQIATDKRQRGHSNMDDLKAALDDEVQR